MTVTVGGASGDVTVDKSALTFTTSDWGTAQTVTVSLGEDDDAVDDEAVTLTHTAERGRLRVGLDRERDGDAGRQRHARGRR